MRKAGLMGARRVGWTSWRGVKGLPPILSLMEPFRVKWVEPIASSTEASRRAALEKAGYNPFHLKARDVTMDLLTDSGTGAMSASQWAAMIAADESYGLTPAYQCFQTAMADLMPNLRHVYPVHQGRAAERIIATLVGRSGSIIPSNSHFDTTQANFEYSGATALNLPTAEGVDHSTDAPFKGNMNLVRLEELLEKNADRVPLIVIVVTNNALGGQPVSMENIRSIAALSRKYDKPFFIDSARFSENAYFIKLREKGYADKPIIDIAREMFSHADGTFMSAKKDALVNIGGLLALNDKMVALLSEARDAVLLAEGDPYSGGLAGRDLAAIAVGIHEAMDEHYLAYRIGQMEYLGGCLRKLDVPIVSPVGGHAVFVNAGAFLDHIPPHQFPGLALANALYLEGGVRAVEIGSLMFGAAPDGSYRQPPFELTRLAFPRRVYTLTHIKRLIQLFHLIATRRSLIPGYRILEDARRLRHFSARLLPIADPHPTSTLFSHQRP